LTRYGGPAVVVDLGTTINFDVVSERGDFLGGMIYPAVAMAIQWLFGKNVPLPLVDLRRPAGKNTVPSIQSGLYRSLAS
jgi:type III pantothenate kinase